VSIVFAVSSVQNFRRHTQAEIDAAQPVAGIVGPEIVSLHCTLAHAVGVDRFGSPLDLC
jgi:hypothetical protein